MISWCMCVWCVGCGTEVFCCCLSVDLNIITALYGQDSLYVPERMKMKME